MCSTKQRKDQTDRMHIVSLSLEVLTVVQHCINQYIQVKMSDLSKCAQFDCLLVRETEKEMDIGEEERIVKPGSDLRNQL